MVLAETDLTGLIPAGVLLLTLLVIIPLAYYTRKGSGIGDHPIDGRNESPGAREPSTPSGKGREFEGPPHRKERDAARHGTR